MSLIEPDAADILEHAAKLIEEWGLAKKCYMNRNGSMCEFGALDIASGWKTMEEVTPGIYHYKYNTADAWSAAVKAEKALNKVDGGPMHSDKQSTTQESAAAKLREAAEYARTHS